jgi:hypothetical protein
MSNWSCGAARREAWRQAGPSWQPRRRTQCPGGRTLRLEVSVLTWRPRSVVDEWPRRRTARSDSPLEHLVSAGARRSHGAPCLTCPAWCVAWRLRY